jgi:hypothetical protein
VEEIRKIEVNAQKAAEARLFDCMEGVFDEEMGESAIGPFCGCNTCIVREVIDAAWPWLYQLAHHEGIGDPS